jgi:type II secretory pathway component GspD/PulD (secretin)
VSVQDAQELGRAVQQALEIPKLTIDGTRRMVMMRDRVSKVYAAEALFRQLVSLKAQIMVEIEFMEIDESSSLHYGLSLPGQFPLALFGNLPRWLAHPSVPSGFLKFLAFGGGASLIGIGLTDSQLFASMTESNSKTLFRAQLRSSDGQPAQLHVGDRYPIASTQYIGGQVSSGSQTYAPPPTFNFEDLGIVIKVTPKVNGPHEMTLAVESEFKVLAGQGLNGIPIISNRKFNSTLSLRDGEWAVIAGLVNSSDAKSISGLYGLSTIPLLGPLVRENTRDKSKSQVVIVIRPLRVGLSGDEMVNTRSFWLGSEARFASSL